MTFPPVTLDGATVLFVADVASQDPTGNTRHVVGGEQVQRFHALAICRYDNGGESVYLFYCDADWNVVTDTFHDSLADAEEQARFEFGDVRFVAVTPGE